MDITRTEVELPAANKNCCITICCIAAINSKLITILNGSSAPSYPGPAIIYIICDAYTFEKIITGIVNIRRTSKVLTNMASKAVLSPFPTSSLTRGTKTVVNAENIIIKIPYNLHAVEKYPT